MSNADVFHQRSKKTHLSTYTLCIYIYIVYIYIHIIIYILLYIYILYIICMLINAFFFWSHRPSQNIVGLFQRIRATLSRDGRPCCVHFLSVPSDRGFPTPCSMLCVQSYSALKMFEPIATYSHIYSWCKWSGWWFGTWLLWLSIYWECRHPNWLSLHHFSRWLKLKTTNQ